MSQPSGNSPRQELTLFELFKCMCFCASVVSAIGGLYAVEEKGGLEVSAASFFVTLMIGCVVGLIFFKAQNWLGKKLFIALAPEVKENSDQPVQKRRVIVVVLGFYGFLFLSSVLAAAISNYLSYGLLQMIYSPPTMDFSKS